MSAAAWFGWMAAALGASWACVWMLASAADRLGLIDHPNHRSLHAAPVPRGGGAGFLAVFAALILPASQSLAIDISPPLWRVLFAGFFVAGVGLADDRFGLPAWLRLSAQIFGALLVAAPWVLDAIADTAERDNMLDLVSLLLAMLGIVAVTNFYNFMDGADGLAAGQGVIALAAAGVVAVWGGHDELALIAGLLAAAVTGFLIHNWHPARIFMGDAGSTFLGFLFGSLAASAAFEPAPAAVPAATWLCLLAPFLADTSITLLRRIWRGEPWYRAHRQHYYQQLIGSGWSHRRVASSYLSVTAVLGGLAVIQSACGGTPTWLLLGAFVVMAAGVGLMRGLGRDRQVAIANAEASPSRVLKHSLR